MEIINFYERLFFKILTQSILTYLKIDWV